MFQSSQPRWEPHQCPYSAHARSHQPPASRAIPITSPPIAIPNAKSYAPPAVRGCQDYNTETKADQSANRRSARTSFSVSSESSFGSASHYYSHPAPPQGTRPRLAALNSGSSTRHFGSCEAPSSWAFREAPPHQAAPSHPSRPAAHRLHTSPNPPPSSYHQPSHSASLPDLRNIRPHAPDVVAARRRLEDNSTKPFSLDPPPFTDHDVPLPHPYNAAYPHPLTAYASPGVNSSSILAVGWRETLAHMMETDIDLVKGSILAASDRNINPPALMIPVFEGEGCGIPERLWSRFESMGEGLTSAVAAAAAPSSSIPPRFAQAGMQVVSTPGGRAGSGVEALPADSFPAVRTNFSNVLRRTSEVDGRAPVPTRRPAPQPTPFHKTELCRTWEHEGVCKYGSNCQFAHGRLELRMPVTGMPTPPSSHTTLPSRYDDPITARPIPDRRASLHPLSFVGEHDSPLLRPLPRRQSTPSPIGAERLASAAPWKTVPVPISHHSTTDPLFSFAEYPYTSDPPHYGGSIGQKTSLSSLSASAASFQSTSTPSTGGYSYSTSPTSFFLSTYPQADFMPPPPSNIWAEQRTSTLIVEAADDADVPDWEMLKRSIDATTIRSVWEE